MLTYKIINTLSTANPSNNRVYTSISSNREFYSFLTETIPTFAKLSQVENFSAILEALYL